MDDSCCFRLDPQVSTLQDCDLQPHLDGCGGVRYYPRYPSRHKVGGGAKVDDTTAYVDDSGCYANSACGGSGDSNRHSSSGGSNRSSKGYSNSGKGDTNSRMAIPSHNTSYMPEQPQHPTSRTSRSHT